MSRGSAPASFLRRAASRAILVVLSVLAGLAACEATARFMGIGLTYGRIFSVERVPIRTVDGVVLWSSAEPRDDPQNLQPAAAAFTLIGLGDSIMYGVGLRREETYLEQTRHLLAARSARAVAIYNLAVPGYNTVQEAAVYKEIAERARPDVVLLHYWEDDGRQYRVSGGHVLDVGDVSADGHVVVRALPLPQGLNDFLLVQSQFYGALTEAAVARQRLTQASQWSRVTEPLADLQQRVRASGARLVILASAQLQGPTPQPTSDLNQLRRFAAPRSIEVIDVSAWLAGLESRAIALDSCHFNAEGHRRIAEHLVEYLLANDLKTPRAARSTSSPLADGRGLG